MFEGHDLLALPERELLEVRGKRIGMIFQEPTASLNPVVPVGDQLLEAMMSEHYDRWRPVRSAALGRSLRSAALPARAYKRAKHAEAVETLRSVQMPAPEEALVAIRSCSPAAWRSAR